MTTAPDAVKLLVPVLDPPSLRAPLAYSTALAEAVSRPLDLTLVAPVPDSGLLDAAGAHLQSVADRTRSNRINVTTIVCVGEAAPTIVQVARSEGADAIVLASDRASRLDSWLNGDLVAQLTRDSATPILIVPSDAANARAPRRVLVPVENGSTPRVADSTVTRLALAAGTEVVLLRVVKVPPLVQAQLETGAVDAQDIHPDLVAVRADLDERVRAFAQDGVQAWGVIRFGDRSRAVRTAARDVRADLVATIADDADGLVYALTGAQIAVLATGRTSS